MPALSAPRRAAGVAGRVPGIEALWAETRGDPEICVAVLDGPVDLSHPCFAGARLTVLETLSSDGGKGTMGAAAEHGTHVASILFGQPGSGVEGIAPGCRGLLLPVFRDAAGGGVRPCSQVDLARAITQAVEAGAHVVNISGGELAHSDVPHPLLANAVELCAERGVLVVAAAGNDGCRCLHLPAAVHPVLVVGAMDEDGEPLPFSNWGDPYQGRGVLAQGRDVPGAAVGGGTALRTGTSAAAPLVSGVAALLLSLQKKRGTAADAYAVSGALLGSSLGCDAQPTAECGRLLAGRLHLSRAIAHLQQGGTVTMSDLLAPAGAPAPEAAPEAVPAPSALHPSWREPAPAVHPSWTTPAPAPAPAPAAAAPAAPEASPGVQPSVCNDFLCGSRRFVYALGQLDYDFNSEANRDWFAQRIDHPDDPAEMLAYLGEGMDAGGADESGASPSHAAALTWVLKLDATPIYAIQPLGPFAERAYAWLRVFLRSQVREGVEMISVPGVLQGRTTLISGLTVPVIVPDHRGMYAWSVERLVETAAADAGEVERDGLDNFLRRVYYELRNLGVTPQERALNYAATNAFQLTHVYGAAVRGGLELDGIKVRPSPICRPGSDCWDVEIVFFDPENLNRASRVYRFTVDVSDALPVAVGEVRSWTSR